MWLYDEEQDGNVFVCETQLTPQLPQNQPVLSEMTAWTE